MTGQKHTYRYTRSQYLLIHIFTHTTKAQCAARMTGQTYSDPLGCECPLYKSHTYLRAHTHTYAKKLTCAARMTGQTYSDTECPQDKKNT